MTAAPRPARTVRLVQGLFRWLSTALVTYGKLLHPEARLAARDDADRPRPGDPPGTSDREQQ